MFKTFHMLQSGLRYILPKTLLARSLLIIVTPLIVVQAVTAYVFFERYWNSVASDLTEAITGEIATAVNLLGENPEAFALAAREMETHLQLNIAVFPGQILDTEAVSKSGTTFFTRRLSWGLAEKIKRPHLIDSDSFPNQVVVQIQLAEGVLQAVIQKERVFGSTTYVFILWMTGTSLVLFFVASVFMRNQVRPIRRLARVADRFGKSELLSPETDEAAVHLELRGATEVRQAALAFNAMSERIQRQIRQRTDMLSAVSHDLRTPLTRMRLAVEMLDDHPSMDGLRRDVQDMESMIDGYLAFVRGESREDVSRVDISALIREITADGRREGLAVHCHIEESLFIDGQRVALKRCMHNLLTNAGQYAGNIWLQVGRRGGGVEVLVDDDGPGIPEPAREDVFRPFFRLDRARNLKTAGTGLGLSIARDIARIHGGDILLSRSPQGGLRALLNLPGGLHAAPDPPS